MSLDKTSTQSSAECQHAAALKLRSVSVIIPCRVWSKELTPCLEAIAAQNADLPIQMVISVNRQDDGMRVSWPGAKIVFEPLPGPAAARNAGVRAADGDVFAFIDSDCVADANWLRSALQALGSCKGKEIIAGSIARPLVEKNSIDLYDKVTFLKQANYVKWSRAFVTANLIVHRSIFDLVGPFDPVFTEAAFEDWDWALRAYKVGVSVKYVADAMVMHPCMSCWSEIRSKSERLARGEIIFARKYGKPLNAISLTTMMTDHARRAWRNTELDRFDRLCVAGVGAVAGFWRWSARHRLLSAESQARQRHR
jgi:GT2 family glycosyltransferase